MTRDLQPGDWVRFYKNGALVIGVVQYVARSDYSNRINAIQTDIGAIVPDMLLEFRGPE